MGFEPTLTVLQTVAYPLGHTDMVGDIGLEPIRYCYHRLLKPARFPFRQSPIILYVEPRGIEPLTSALQKQRSTK